MARMLNRLVSKLHLTNTTPIQTMFKTKRYIESLAGYIDDRKIVRSPYQQIDIPETSLYGHVFNQFDQYGSKTALIDPLKGREISFAELRDITCRMSSGLCRMGLEKGDIVTIFAPNSTDYNALFFATLAAGGIVSTCNPTYTVNEFNYQVKNCGCKFVATIPTLFPTVMKAVEGTTVEKVIVMDEVNQKKDNATSLNTLLDDSGSLFQDTVINVKKDIAVLPYSSGTTGLPKGVMLTHYNIVANICQLKHPEIQQFAEDEILMAILPYYHIYGMVVVMFSALYQGKPQIVLPKFEPVTFLESIQRYHPTWAHVAPPLILFLAKHPDVSKYDICSLQRVISGGAPLGGEVVEETKRRTGIKNIQQAYGLTETSPVTHWNPAKVSVKKPRSVGFPIQNQLVKVVNLSTGDALGPNEEGELIVSGPNIMLGYLNRPDATKECITDDGWFHTGDIGYYDEHGHFYITDRLKELIKVKGFQVAPAELEALLVHHPMIADAAVIGIQHERQGEAPKAFVVRRESSLTEDHVMAYVKERVAEYKWLVGGVEFIDEIPKSPSGKILRRTLNK